MVPTYTESSSPPASGSSSMASNQLRNPDSDVAPPAERVSSWYSRARPVKASSDPMRRDGRVHPTIRRRRSSASMTCRTHSTGVRFTAAVRSCCSGASASSSAQDRNSSLRDSRVVSAAVSRENQVSCAEWSSHSTISSTSERVSRGSSRNPSPARMTWPSRAVRRSALSPVQGMPASVSVSTMFSTLDFDRARTAMSFGAVPSAMSEDTPLAIAPNHGAFDVPPSVEGCQTRTSPPLCSNTFGSATRRRTSASGIDAENSSLVSASGSLKERQDRSSFSTVP